MRVPPNNHVRRTAWLIVSLLTATLLPSRAQTGLPPAVATDIATLEAEAARLDKAGKPADALPLARRALEARLAAPGGADTPETARALNDVAELCRKTANYPEALAFCQQGLAIREQVFGPDSTEAALSLTILARVYRVQSDFVRAEPPARRALVIQEKLLPPDSPDLATSLNGLGVIRYKLGGFTDAASLYERALAIREKSLGPDHPDTASVLGNLAQLYNYTGDYARAEPFTRRALAIREKALGPDHPDLAMSLLSLAALDVSLGDYARAEPVVRRAIDLWKKAGVADSVEVATGWNALGSVELSLGNPSQARAAYGHAVEIFTKVVGPAHRDTAFAVSNLAEATAATGDKTAAEALFRGALATWDKLDRPDVQRERAAALGKFADLRASRGALEEAETVVRRALAMQEKWLGPESAEAGGSLRQLALLRFWRGAAPEAAEFARRAQTAGDALLANVLSFTPQPQRLDFQATTDPWSLAATLGDAELVAGAVLRAKGVVLDSLLEDRLAAEASADPDKRRQLDQARALQRELARLNQEDPGDGDPATLKKRDEDRASAAAKFDAAEAAMARAVTGLGRARRALDVTPAQVRAALPAGAALVEFLRYQNQAAPGRSETCYGAVVLRADAPAAAWVPLGSARIIEERLAAYQRGVRGRENDLDLEESLVELSRLVWAPVAKLLPAGTREVIISPDAELNFLSFATLLTGEGVFVGERHLVSYVGGGRDLLVATAPGAGKGTLLAFANPLMDTGAGGPLTIVPPVAAAAGRGMDREVFRDTRFAQLPGAESEGRDIVALAKKWGWQGELFSGAAATERRLAEVRSPRVLHLATHGFFLSAAAGGAGGGRRNPMRCSGLALAGAATTLAAWSNGRFPPPNEDGIVTAEEVAALDLRGTWLVTLSACESGGGEARAGEGVLGLRRGFALAGARNLLLTLWPVADRETAGLMLDFYAAAERTGNPGRALAETQRAHLTRLRNEQGLAPAARLAGAFILSSSGR